MAHLMVFFFKKCRLCLDKQGAQNIFDNNYLAHDIFSYTGIEVSQSDSLPQQICNSCAEIINNAKELKVLAKKNDNNLRSLFDTDTDDSNTETGKENISNILDIEEKTNESVKCKSPQKETAEKQSIKRIAVRKDLFETQSMTSSTSAQGDDDSSPEKANTNKRLKKENNESVELKCDVCSKIFDKWKKLYLHKRLHNKTICCTENACEKKFSTKGDLEKHIRTHTGEKPFHCAICDQSFSQNGTLKTHFLNVHKRLSD